MWKEVVEKAIDIELEANLQPFCGTKEIDSRCPKDYRPSAKKYKDKAIREYWDRNKDKAKSHNLSFTNSQP